MGNIGCVGKRLVVVAFDVGVFYRKVLLKGGHSVTQQSWWNLIQHGWSASIHQSHPGRHAGNNVDRWEPGDGDLVPGKHPGNGRRD